MDQKAKTNMEKHFNSIDWLCRLCIDYINAIETNQFNKVCSILFGIFQNFVDDELLTFNNENKKKKLQTN